MQFHNIVMLDYARPLSARLEARKHAGPYHWTPTKPGTGRAFYQAQDGLFCDPRGSTFDLRLDYATTHWSSWRTPASYHCEMEGDTVLTPIVARLPRGRGFLAGWTMGRGMCAELDGTIHETIEEAARMAHEEARIAAERQREFEEEEQARMAEEDAAEARAEAERQECCDA